MPTKPDRTGKAFSALFALLALGALAVTIRVAADDQYNAAATIVCAGVTLGLAFFSAVPWIPRRGGPGA